MDNIDDTLETRSVCSNTSRASQRSSASAIAARARAKAEAARMQASFAKREADVIKAQAYIEEQQQKAAAEATRKKAELEASLHTLRLEGAAAAAIAEAKVLEAAAENEQEELDRVSLKSAERKSMEDLRPGPYGDSTLLEPTPTPTRQLTMDSGEAAVNNMGKSIDELSEASQYELCDNDLPVQHTFKAENDTTPYYPHLPTATRIGP